jgi:hypothetical protein
LTRNDKSKQGPSGGPITKDNTSVEYYDTIFTVMESPVQAGTIWTGSDDGLLYVTRDAGKNWSNVTPPKAIMPEWIQINSLDASPFDAATAYVAATMYKHDDYKPYLYKTSDYGKTWKKITNGIPENAFTRVIREDPNKRGLLYAGTEPASTFRSTTAQIGNRCSSIFPLFQLLIWQSTNARRSWWPQRRDARSGFSTICRRCINS